MDQILLIDKPVGISSFDVIRRLRRKINIRKMGHAGTLDPLASGLMIIAVGGATKKLAAYLKLDKEYEAEILLGIKTESGDLDGRIVEKREVTKEAAETLSAERVSAALESLVGEITLPVSVYSAIKKDGVPLYKKARAAKARGESLSDDQMPIRKMVVHSADLIELIDQSQSGRFIIKARFKVGSGTYIRSLGEKLGEILDYPAVLQNLRRTKIGDFNVKDAERV